MKKQNGGQIQPWKALVTREDYKKFDKYKRKIYLKRGFVEKVDLKVLYDKYDGTCQICGCKCDWTDSSYFIGRDGRKCFKIGKRYPTQDHIVPLSMGGEESYKNSQLLCMNCNAHKNNKKGNYR